jgi:hypothetical protein
MLSKKLSKEEKFIGSDWLNLDFTTKAAYESNKADAKTRVQLKTTELFI